MPHRIIHPEGWKPAKGYANGVLSEGRVLNIGGQIGWDADQVFRVHDFIGQMEQCLRNIVAVTEAAGGGAEHVTRLTWFVKDKKAYLAAQGEVGAAYRRVMGRNFPAMSFIIVSDLLEDEALLEIEATAVIPD